MHTAFCRIAAAALFAVSASTHAQTAPPIKTGLWQMQVEQEGAPAMPDMSEQLKKMPPEQRKQVEAMMKERGVDVSGGGLKMCISKESLEQNTWQGPQGQCSTEVLSRSASSWRWRSTCSEPKAESEGEAIFASPESYTVKSTTTVSFQGAPKTVRSTIRSTWLGADCGGLKPMVAPKGK